MQKVEQEINNLIRNEVKEIVSEFHISELVDYDKLHITNGIDSDYQFSQILFVSKKINLDSYILLDRLVDSLNNSTHVDSVKSIALKQNTIITFNINKNVLTSLINDIYCQTIRSSKIPVPEFCEAYQNRNIVIDFSSPNIAKEMHVGHLRSTIIGESLARVFEYSGANVSRINHIGDWGTQFGMLIAYIKLNNIEEYNISQLMTIYQKARVEFTTNDLFKKRAYAETVKLQNKDNENIDIWKKICEISMNSFNEIYKQLGTHATVCGESFYQDKMIDLVKNLDDKIIRSDGMKLMFSPKFKVPLILQKSDGGFTYDTSDLTALHYRLVEQNAHTVIYVVDSSQQLHFEILFQVASELGWTNENHNLFHVGFGLVLGSDSKKIKTRSGEIVRLVDLLDQANEHATALTTMLAQEKHLNWAPDMIREVSKKIAFNCIKYSDLSNPRLSNYKYDPKRMISTKGNTAVYLMYALARCRAILRKIPNIDFEYYLCDNELLTIDSSESRNLVTKMCQYPQYIEKTIQHLSPHFLCNYLYDFVDILGKFYETNKCISFTSTGEISHIFSSRIKLIFLSEHIILQFFRLIGLEEIEQI